MILSIRFYIKLTCLIFFTLPESISAQIPAPVADFTISADSICQGDSIEFIENSANNPDSIVWSFQDGTPSSSIEKETSVTFSSFGSKLISLIAFNSTGSDTIIKTVYIDPKVGINLSKTDASCDQSNGSIKATAILAEGSPTYRWSNGETTAKITALDTGVYMITVNNGRCMAKDSAIIKQMGKLSVTDSVKYIGCDKAGGVNAQATVFVLGGVPPYTYSWSDYAAQTTATATGLPAGDYIINILDANGCSVKDSIKVEEVLQLETVYKPASCDTCTNGEASVKVSGFGIAPYFYRWNDENEQTTQTATGLPPGNYTVTVTDDNGCRNIAMVNLPTGMAETFGIESIKLYPNPAIGGNIYFDIKLNNPQTVVLEFADILGKVHFRQRRDLHGFMNHLSVDRQKLGSPGIYFVTLFSEDRTSGNKILYSAPLIIGNF